LKQLADAERELGEAVTAAEEEAAAPGDAAATADRTAAAAAGEVEGDGSLDDFGFGGEAFAAAHMPVARATLGLLRAVVGMVKAVVRRLLSERCTCPVSRDNRTAPRLKRLRTLPGCVMPPLEQPRFLR
jgi:hypothetical protein